MKLLLDTHAWLWWQMAPERLAQATREAMSSDESDVYLSAVSSWEMAINIAAGKLQLPRPLREMVPESLMQDGFVNLPMQPAHCFRLGRAADAPPRSVRPDARRTSHVRGVHAGQR